MNITVLAVAEVVTALEQQGFTDVNTTLEVTSSIGVNIDAGSLNSTDGVLAQTVAEALLKGSLADSYVSIRAHLLYFKNRLIKG